MKFKFSTQLDLVGCEQSEIVEIDDEELKGMSPQEVDTYVEEEHLKDWAYQHLDYWCERVEEE